MFTVRARRFLQRTGRKLRANRPTSIRFDPRWSAITATRKDTLQGSVGLLKIQEGMAKEEPTNYALMAFTSSSSSSSDNEGDESLPPSPIYDSPFKSDKDLSPTHRPLAPIIEDSVSDSEDDSEAMIPQNVPSFVQPNEQVKTHRSSVKLVETFIPAANHKTVIPKPKCHGNSRNR
nr:hypothetical protein [Tanacetum cinerariifolium]